MDLHTPQGNQVSQQATGALVQGPPSGKQRGEPYDIGRYYYGTLTLWKVLNALTSGKTKTELYLTDVLWPFNKVQKRWTKEAGT